MSGIEGEFYEDSAPEPDTDYHGELRYINKPPTVLAGMIETETDPEEKSAMEYALSIHRKMQPGMRK